MIFAYIILSVAVIIGTALFLETKAEHKIKHGLLEDYAIKKDTSGSYYITGSKLWVTDQPKELEGQFFNTEEKAERALKDYMRKQLLKLESDKFAKVVKLSESRIQLSAEIATAQLEAILKEQDEAREREIAILQEAARVREGNIPSNAREILDKSVDAPRKRSKVTA